MRGIMPEPLPDSKGKIGFILHHLDWFIIIGPPHDWLSTEVSQQDFLQSELWNGPAIRRLVDTKRSTMDPHEAEQIWPALHTQLLATYISETAPIKIVSSVRGS
jgi:hypothetical protein